MTVSKKYSKRNEVNIENKLLCLVAGLCLIGYSCQGPGRKEAKPTEDQPAAGALAISSSDYPTAVADDWSKRMYDKTRWALYCIYCDDTCRWQKTSGIRDTVTFGGLELRFDRMETLKDTVEFYFNFYFHDSVKCDANRIGNYYAIVRGMGFRRSADTMLYYIFPSTMRYFRQKGPESRYDQPLQPAVREYIQKNQERLNGWFRAEARKRGVLGGSI